GDSLWGDDGRGGSGPPPVGGCGAPVRGSGFLPEADRGEVPPNGPGVLRAQHGGGAGGAWRGVLRDSVPRRGPLEQAAGDPSLRRAQRLTSCGHSTPRPSWIRPPYWAT